MSFFAQTAPIAPISMSSLGSSPTFQPASNTFLYVIFFAFFIMCGMLFGIYLVRMDKSDLGKKWFEEDVAHLNALQK
jgi:hypothetical protein